MSESKSDALDQLGEEGILFGGPEGNRTPTRGLQSHCAPVITTSPNFGVPPETRTPTKGFGDPRAAITPARYYLVPEAGLEPARSKAGDFKSPVSTIPPFGLIS